ncbi:MAG TPA: RcnB family protein [Caulobacteraceae bacterium]|nr:RcnB family protein [Caulobacteraceae bacterium]
MPRSPRIIAAVLAVAVALASAAGAQEGRRGGQGAWRASGRSVRPPPAARGAPMGRPARANSWDPARHNGFWYGGRWYYGPPPSEYGAGVALPGHNPWRRGGYLPSYYRGAVIDDYARYRLRRPPYGYRWVYAGGDFMMVAASTGLIFDVIPGR